MLKVKVVAKLIIEVFIMTRDFNSLFWTTWGIHQRVYIWEDVFRVKNSFTEPAKKRFHKFKNNTNMKIDAFLETLYKEPNEFYLLFNNLFYKVDNDESIELIKELNNIAFTLRFLDIFSINDNNKKIELFAFQIAFIIEKIKKLNIDISIFEDALKTKSFKPYLDYYIQKSNKTQNGIAHDFHETFIKLTDAIAENYDSAIKDIQSEKVFINDVSQWMNGQLPEFLKLLVINVTLFSSIKKNEQRAQLILMLILRALLYIKREYNLDEKIEEQFLEKLNNYKIIIQERLKDDKKEDLEVLKSNYCINFEKMIFELNEKSLDLNILGKYCISFCKDLNDFDIEKDLQKKMIDYMSKNVKWHY